MAIQKRRIVEKVHPRQTKYYILAKPPEMGNITYQIDDRATEFLTDELGFVYGDALPWSLVHPFRVVSDLFTLDEGRPEIAHPSSSLPSAQTTPTMKDGIRMNLIDYLRNHPDITGDFEILETKLNAGISAFTDAISRTQYSASTELRFDGTRNEAFKSNCERVFLGRLSLSGVHQVES